MPRRLFVYESVMPGGSNEHVLSGIEGSWRRGSVRGRLLARGWGSGLGYPAIVLDDDADPVPGYVLTSDRLDPYVAMKHKSFFLLCAAVMSFLFIVVGVLALVGYPGAEVRFWTRSAIESRAGKIAWIAGSAASLVICLGLLVRERRKGNDRSSTTGAGP